MSLTPLTSITSITSKTLLNFINFDNFKKISAMNKKDYQKPAMRVVKIQHQQHLLTVSNDKTWDAIGQGEDNEDPY